MSLLFCEEEFEIKESVYQTYDDLPLFLNAKIRAVGKTQRSGFAGERRRSGMSEFSPFWSETREMELATTKRKARTKEGAGGYGFVKG